jgi:hypothetical protein
MAEPELEVEVTEDPEPVTAPEPSEHPWGEDWREDYAGDDEKKLAYAGKYASPTAALDAGLAAQYKISSGEFRPVVPFPDEGDEKEQASWRKDNGVPKDAKGYDLGMDIDEDHQAAVEAILEYGWNNNQSSDSIKQSVQYYFDHDQAEKEAEHTADLAAQSSAEDELRAEWGPEYRANVNIINAFLNTAKEGVRDNILNARFPDGTPFCSDPDAMRFLIDAARIVNPQTTLVHLADDDKATLTDRINQIKGMMRTGEYYKGPQAEALQKEYEDLTHARLQSEGKIQR